MGDECRKKLRGKEEKRKGRGEEGGEGNARMVLDTRTDFRTSLARRI